MNIVLKRAAVMFMGFVVTVGAVTCRLAEAQAVQFVRALDTPDATESVQKRRDVLAARYAWWKSKSEDPQLGGDPDNLKRLAQLQSLTVRAMAAPDQRSADQLLGEASIIEAQLATAQRPPDQPQYNLRPDPTPHQLVPEIAFGLGLSYTVADSSDAFEVAIGTNLVGAGVGVVLGAVGSETLKDYFVDNMIVAVSVPTGNKHRISSQLAVGLGSLPLIRGSLVTASLSFDQFQPEDVRVPRTAVQGNPNASNWSSPMLSIGFAFQNLEKTRARLKEGKFTPIMTVGVGAAQYYPDNSLKALAALFTDDHKKYVRSGSVRFNVGLYMPLFPIKAK